MKNRFYSKIDWWILALFGAAILLCIIYIIQAILKGTYFILLINIPLVIFLTYILIGTYYEFHGNYLLVKTGPFKQKLYYDKIMKIELKKSVLASASLSRDRIEIIYNRSVGAQISLRDKEEFLKILESKCENLKGVNLN